MRRALLCGAAAALLACPSATPCRETVLRFAQGHGCQGVGLEVCAAPEASAALAAIRPVTPRPGLAGALGCRAPRVLHLSAIEPRTECEGPALRLPAWVEVCRWTQVPGVESIGVTPRPGPSHRPGP